MHLERLGVGTVDLVDENDRREAGFEGFLEDETGLSLGAFVGVDNEHDAVDHFHDALHFAAEVRVSGSVDDVDEIFAPANGGILRLDRDASLAFLVHRVHGTLVDGLVFTEGSGLFEHLVHEGGFAMINVGDDGDVTDAIRGDGDF